MNRLTLSVLLMILFVLPSVGQKTVTGTLRGKIADTIGKQSMEEATISLMDLKDSSSVGFTVAQ